MAIIHLHCIRLVSNPQEELYWKGGLYVCASGQKDGVETGFIASASGIHPRGDDDLHLGWYPEADAINTVPTCANRRE